MIRLLDADDVDAFIHIRKAGLRNHPFSFGASPDRVVEREQTQKDLVAKNDEILFLVFC